MSDVLTKCLILEQYLGLHNLYKSSFIVYNIFSCIHTYIPPPLFLIAHELSK